MAKEQLHEDRSGQPTPPNIQVLTIVLAEFDGKSQDRYAKQILNYFLSVDFTANLAGHFFHLPSAWRLAVHASVRIVWRIRSDQKPLSIAKHN